MPSRLAILGVAAIAIAVVVGLIVARATTPSVHNVTRKQREQVLAAISQRVPGSKVAKMVCGRTKGAAAGCTVFVHRSEVDNRCDDWIAFFTADGGVTLRRGLTGFNC